MIRSAWLLGDERHLALLSRTTGKPGDTVVAEETIFGILSRHHVLTGHTAARDTLIALVNRGTFSPSTTFPNSLQAILAQLKLPIRSVQELIQHHTVLPYFRPFMSATRYCATLQSIAAGNGPTAKISLGVVASGVGAETLLRFCPNCAKEDHDTIGVATWYRVHQLPGVLLCPYHGIPLMESTCLAQRLNRHHLFLPAEDDRRFHCTVAACPADVTAKLLLLATLSAQVLTLRKQAPTSLRQSYTQHLFECELASSIHRIRQQELRERFVLFWKPLMQLPPFDRLLASCHDGNTWLAGLCRKARRIHHPLKHLLLIGFLADDLPSFFQSQLRSTIKQDGSPAAVTTSLDQAREQQLMALIKAGNSIRQAAAALGVSINTALAQAERANISIARRPKKLPPLAREAIRKSLAAGKDIQAIAKSHGVSTTTVNRILGGSRELQRQRAAYQHEARRTIARNNVLSKLRQCPTMGWKALRLALPADFIWLYRHDNAWLSQLPLQAHQTRSGTPRVDWAARDVTMCRQVRRAAIDIISRSEKPVRVTLNEIGRHTGHPSWLEKRLHKLPKTRRLLSKALESVEEFQARRMRWWKKQLSAAEPYESIADWRVERAAGIPSRLRHRKA